LAGVFYGPAKYGILAELVPSADLVLANAWIEVATVSAILGGTALGATLLKVRLWIGGLDTAPRQASLLLGSLFALAALCGCAIPPTSCSKAHEDGVAARFVRQLAALWHDPQGQVSLAVTVLFWAVAAVLQFLVIRWAESVLRLSLGEAALLQCCMAAGVVAGALGVARCVSASSAARVLPAGVILGLAIVLVSQVEQLWIACVALCAIGIVAGVLMVPMNALLQQRGNALMRPGESIAVQSFSENLASLASLAVYGLLLTLAVPVRAIIVGFGVLIAGLMLMIWRPRSSHGRHAA
jgi:hypothetical protein